MNVPKLVVCFIIALFFALPLARAQRFEAPEGEAVTARIIDGTTRIVATGQSIYASYYSESDKAWVRNQKVWTDPEGRRIVDMQPKIETEYPDAHRCIVLLDDGTVYSILLGPPAFGRFTFAALRLNPIETFGSEGFKKAIGDDIYVLSTSKLYVTHDNGQTWQIDTAGLNGAHVNDIAMDSAQHVLAATTKGLLEQQPGSNQWSGNIEPSYQNFISVFITQHQVLWAATDNDSMITWTGTSWRAEPTPIQVFKIGDDAWMDLFLIDADGKLYSDRSGSYTDITNAINTAAGMPTNGTSTLRVNDIGGDSILLAATNYGLFTSIDRGDTWQQSNDGIHAERFYGFVKDPTGFFMASTSQGIFMGTPGTKWNKTYPTQGYMGGVPLVTGGYSTYAILPSYPRVLRTSDGGSNWLPDSLGESAIDFGGIMAVDENGTLHAVSSHYGSSWKGYIYEKKLGEAWHADTLGYSPKNYSYGESIASNGSDRLFVSGVFPGGERVMMRQTATPGWIADTIGLDKSVNYFTMFVRGAKDGSMYATNGSTLWFQAGHKIGWSACTIPIKTRSITAMSVDSNYVLYVSMGGSSIYYTTDGFNWTFAGYNGLDIQSLYSDGATTYAATNNGIYQVAAAAATASTGVSPTTLDFGNIAVGDSTSQIVTIANTGTEALNITSISSPDPSFTSQGFINLVAPMDSLKFPVQFKPTHGGPVTSTLSIAIANDPSSPFIVTLKGNGVASSVAETNASSLTLTNYPNPFSQATTLSFTLPERERATIIVRDILGHDVTHVADGMFDTGKQSVQWNAGTLPEGVYVVEMRAGETVARRFVTVMR